MDLVFHFQYLSEITKSSYFFEINNIFQKFIKLRVIQIVFLEGQQSIRFINKSVGRASIVSFLKGERFHFVQMCRRRYVANTAQKVKFPDLVAFTE